eukprot:10497280-Ditylum_brightwellii.AAC.1
MLVASSPKGAFSYVVAAALDPSSLVNLDMGADSSVPGHSTLLLVRSSFPSTLQSTSFKDADDTPSATIPDKDGLEES